MGGAGSGGRFDGLNAGINTSVRPRRSAWPRTVSGPALKQLQVDRGGDLGSPVGCVGRGSCSGSGVRLARATCLGPAGPAAPLPVIVVGLMGRVGRIDLVYPTTFNVSRGGSTAVTAHRPAAMSDPFPMLIVVANWARWLHVWVGVGRLSVGSFG